MKDQKQSLLFVICICLFGALLSSCNDTPEPFDYQAQLNKEINAIDDFLSTSGLQAVKDPTGVRIVIHKLGTGLPAQITSPVNIEYVGTLFTDGSKFDEGTSYSQSTLKYLQLGQFINGWRIAFTQLPEGSEATLYIPSYYAYGNSSSKDIPANSTLVFEVKFKDIVHTSEYLQQLKSDTSAIKSYLTGKGIVTARDTTGIRYAISGGSGPTPGLYDKMKVSYSFKNINNDSKTLISLDREPSEFFYSRPVDYIQGMLIGFRKMPVGSKATLYVPSGLGFGANGATDNIGQVIIPSNTNLIIEVELKEIQ